MTKTRREIERKYEADHDGLPDLTGVPGVTEVVDAGVTHLDATYYDTADERLAADGITLRRRTGGDDAGWHLKLPVAPGVRDEIQAPSATTSPRPSPRWSARASAAAPCCPSSGCAPSGTHGVCSAQAARCWPRPVPTP